VDPRDGSDPRVPHVELAEVPRDHEVAEVLDATQWRGGVHGRTGRREQAGHGARGVGEHGEATCLLAGEAHALRGHLDLQARKRQIGGARRRAALPQHGQIGPRLAHIQPCR
jgi:hypothetical protein